MGDEASKGSIIDRPTDVWIELTENGGAFGKEEECRGGFWQKETYPITVFDYY